MAANSITIDEVFDRKLIFVAGKGGVGKSTVSAALALAAARRGYSVCLVESDGQEQMAPLFGTEAVGYEGHALAPNVYGISVTTQDALREYVKRHLPLHTLSRRLINNRLVRYFLDATPGLKELLVLGKLTDLIAHQRFDIVILDMPATGHGLAMLGVPDVVMEAVHAGPLRRQAEETHALINDAERTAICFVALAEELATTETIELYEAVRASMKCAIGPVIANGVHEPLFGPGKIKRYASLKKQWLADENYAPLIEGGELAMARAALNQRYVEQLRQAFNQEPLIVPFLFIESIDRNALSQISDALTAGGET